MLILLTATACGGGTHAADGGRDAGPTCTSAAQCATGLICKVGDGGTGVCAGCQVNGDCPAQDLCSASNTCVFRPDWGDDCTLNADCPTGDFCVQGLCATAADTTLCQRGNCPSGQTCNTQNQVCEQDLGCTVNSSCLATEVCNPATLACEPRCGADDAGTAGGVSGSDGGVCDDAQKCVAGRCVDCTQSSDCGAGLTCDVAAGTCSATGLCYSDQTCAAGQVCDLASNTCGPVQPPCTSDDNCQTGQVCDAVRGLCVPDTCQPDQFFPNQTEAEAAPVQTGTSYENLTLCGPSDQDWYALQLVSGDEIQVTVQTTVIGAGYSFVVQLVDSAGTTLDKGTDLALNGIAPTTGVYYLLMTDADPDCIYTFSTLVSHGLPCPADRFGDQGSPGSAVVIDGGVGTIYLCAGQVDWFSAAVPPTGLSVTLGSDPTQGPLGISAVLADGGVLASNNAGTALETIAVPPGTPSPVLLEITGDGADNNAYTLTLAPLPADAGTPDSGPVDAGSADAGGALGDGGETP